MTGRRAALVPLLCVAMAVAVPPGAAWAREAVVSEAASPVIEPFAAPGSQAPSAAAERALDPTIPLAVPPDPPSPQSAAAPLWRPDPRDQYIQQRLAHKRAGVQRVEEEEEGTSLRGTGLFAAGSIVLFFGVLALAGGATRRAQYVPSNCDRDEFLSFCPVFEKDGTGLLTIGTMAVIASSGLLLGGGLMLRRYRRAQIAVQRTPRGTWTTGVTLRF